MVGLIVKATQNRGLGVFSTRHFEKGDLIECCRVIAVVKTEINLNYGLSTIRNYVVEWDGKYAIPTGFGPWYNHSYQPNAIIAKHYDINEIHFHALHHIHPYDEVTFNYGGYPDCTDPLWFEVKDS